MEGVRWRFELSPYDMEIGIDEKQDNFNILMEDLRAIGEAKLADELTVSYDKVRAELLQFYKALPRCVFQGDENFSNLCVDEENHIIGLFDFNMSGSEVIANYLANIAFQGNFYYTDEIVAKHSADEIFHMVMDSYKKSTELIKEYYAFTAEEWRAYKLYSKIVMISGYVNQAAFSYFLKKENEKAKIIRLIQILSAIEF
ncbi:MAG: hypothetical protein IJY09_05195 [Lachnospiraceae bacterium]|nr:hypothetical protein [Lachnospiraceae bacterium]